MALAQLRDNYNDFSNQLHEKDINLQQPLQTIESWIKNAVDAKLTDANAMNISTIKTLPNGQIRPSARVVLCKEVCHAHENLNKSGLIFFTNKASNKGQQLAKNNHIAATFFWPQLHKSIRIEGQAFEIPDSDNDNYFYSRPIGSQIGAMVSEQSQKVESKQVLLDRFADLTEKNEGKRPESWGGYLIAPDLIEFWQGNTNRVHDRIVLEKNGENWENYRLQP